MTLNSYKAFSTVHASIIALSLISSPLAQTPRERLGVERAAAQEPQRTEEAEKAAQELEKKALALLDELVAEAASLRSVENRVYILTSAADVWWTRDEERARALAREAMDQVVAYMRDAKEQSAQEDGQYFDPRFPRRRGAPAAYLRQSVLNLLARRDARLALEFLQLTRSLRPTDNARNPGGEQQEKALEMNLASQVAESDPQTALRIAEKYLDGKLDYQVIQFWSVLQRKDPNAASSLTEKIISALKSRDILNDFSTSGFVFNVLSVLRARVNEIARAQNNPDAAGAAQPDLAVARRAYLDALEIVVAAALKITANDLINREEANRARNLLGRIQNYLGDIEKLLPSRAAAVRAKVAQFGRTRRGASAERFYSEYGRELHDKSLQELLALASKAPEGVRQGLYHQAVNKAIEQGDEETARKIIRDNVSDKWQANNLLSRLERSASERAISEGRYAEARQALARMSADEQRASALAGWASAAASKGDVKSAREMLEEARTIIGSQMRRRDQLEAQMAIANAALNIDLNVSFEIAEAAIERINRLIAASLELQTFNRTEESGAWIMSGGAWGEYTGSAVPLFAALARKDFDRAANLLRHWQTNEIRLMMGLSLVQNILGGQGIRYGYGRYGRNMGNITPLRRLTPAMRRP